MSQTSLIAIVKRGDLINLRRAVDDGADLEEKDSQGWTPLFHAAGTGNLAMVKLLLDAGATVNQGLETGFTALFSAVMSDHVKVVKELLRSGAKAQLVQGIELRSFSKSKEVRDLLDNSN
jgi:ankyrin repeat protein